MSIVIQRRVARVVAAVALAITVIGTPAPAAASTSLRVTTSCFSNPEKVAIRNTGTTRLRIRSVGSIYQARTNEPFYVYRYLNPGSAITFYSGYAASSTSSNTLTRQYIFNNDVGSREGARVVLTSGQAYGDRCG